VEDPASDDGAVAWIDRSIGWALDGAGFERVRLRGDTDFSLTAHFDAWSVRGVEFVFRNLTLEQEHVAELEYRPRKARRSYRLVVLRKKIKVTEGQLLLDEEIRYFFYVTNVAPERLGTAAVVRKNHGRCDQENLIEQFKNGVRATRIPVAELHANWAYLVIGALAWNTKAWTGLVLPERPGARAWSSAAS